MHAEECGGEPPGQDDEQNGRVHAEPDGEQGSLDPTMFDVAPGGDRHDALRVQVQRLGDEQRVEPPPLSRVEERGGPMSGRIVRRIEP